MQEPDPKLRLQLASALDLFSKKQYPQCKKLLQDIKTTHLSIELNTLLTDYKEDSTRLPATLKKIMDILVAVNIRIYQERPQQGKKRTPQISHEFYFWNILVLSQLLPNPEISQLIGNEALHFVNGLRTETSLMIIYQMLKTMQSSGRLASCISLIEKQNVLMSRVKMLTPNEQEYRFMNQILFCKVLLKLGTNGSNQGMIEGGRIMYMMKFNQNLEEPKDGEITQINGVHISVHQQLLHAEIQYHAKNYTHALKILSEIMAKVDSLGRNKEHIKQIIDHNVALVLVSYQQTAAARSMLQRTLNYLTREKGFSADNERLGVIAKCRDNLLLATLASPSTNYESAFESLSNHHNSYSYKLNYRKAQLCLNYYHQLLKEPERVLTYQEIHDFYDTVYYYPNMPYFQQKGKNKNHNYTNAKFVYRRYVIGDNEKDKSNQENRVDKDVNVRKNSTNNGKEGNQVKKEPSREKKSVGKKKGRKEEEPKEDVVKEETQPRAESQSKFYQILTMCQSYLKDALIILEKEKSIILNLEDEEKGLTKQVNEKLYSEFITYKSSIYSLLCYVYLSKHDWHQTIHYATIYQAFQKQYQLQGKDSSEQKTYYNILTYQLQAYTQLNRIEKSYDLLHEMAGSVDYTDGKVVSCCSAGAQGNIFSYEESGQIYFEDMSQYNNFGYNLSVLHSRNNKIPEAYTSIQKLLQQMREIPTNPKANLPLSLIELLIHYNLRTSNQQSAIQLIKRRRILNLPGVIGHYNPTLSITK